MNPIAAQLNEIIAQGNPNLLQMLSPIGQALFFPKGILSQGAEAKEKAHRFNATIGIATDRQGTMHLDSIMGPLGDLRPEETLNYAPSFGLPALRELWQAALRGKNPGLKDKAISLPVVTAGVTHGLSTFSDLWVCPGDGIVLPEMMWGNYNMIFQVRKGARILTHNLFNDAGGLDLDAFARTVRSEAEARGKVIALLNFPQNPSGYTPTEAEADRIADILAEAADGGAQVIAAVDDAYFGLFYTPEAARESLFVRLADRHPRLLAVKLDGATKENFVWGLRVGFITYGCPVTGDARPVYEALEKKTAGCIRGTISNASHLSQRLVLQSMRSPDYPREKQEKFETLKRRALRVKQVLADPKYAEAWDVYPFNSGYFMCLRLKTVAAEDLRVHLLDRYGVGLIALGEANLRVAFSCIEEDDIQALFDIILQGVQDLSQP
ncbi:MAG TPA: aminotransferase class I/II-fold pyridoxal phosphate-dependent enzyme [Desulfobacteraceae bacterium]|nr:aminotransferase class I/II-fold pyridoxal phosphate-dependent enzyme [Desulfobacteraceae bacterium]